MPFFSSRDNIPQLPSFSTYPLAPQPNLVNSAPPASTALLRPVLLGALLESLETICLYHLQQQFQRLSETGSMYTSSWRFEERAPAAIGKPLRAIFPGVGRDISVCAKLLHRK